MGLLLGDCIKLLVEFTPIGEHKAADDVANAGSEVEANVELEIGVDSVIELEEMTLWLLCWFLCFSV